MEPMPLVALFQGNILSIRANSLIHLCVYLDVCVWVYEVVGDIYQVLHHYKCSSSVLWEAIWTSFTVSMLKEDISTVNTIYCKLTFQSVLWITDSWLDLFVLWFIIHWHIWLCSSNCSMQQQHLHLMEHKWINKSRWWSHLNVWHLLMRQLREQRTNAGPALHWLIPARHYVCLSHANTYIHTVYYANTYMQTLMFWCISVTQGCTVFR